MPGPIEIQYCITQREPLILVHNDGGVLGLLTEKHLRALCPAWLDNVEHTATVRADAKHYVYGFIPDRHWPSATTLSKSLEWVNLRLLHNENLTEGLRLCLKNFLDAKYYVPVILDREGRVLLGRILGDASWFPGCTTTAPTKGEELALCRVVNTHKPELSCQISFYNPSPCFYDKIMEDWLGCLQWFSPAELTSIRVEHVLAYEFDACLTAYWSNTLSDLQYYLLDEVLNVPNVLAKVTRFGPPSVSVYDLIT